MTNMQAAALNYARRGWRVLPLHTIRDGRCTCGRVCASPGKHPVANLVPHGLQDASDDLAVVERWWSTFPDANIGIATGARSGLWVLDLDAKRSVQLSDGVLVPEGEYNLMLLEEEHDTLPETDTVSTGSGGKHYYFSYPNEPGVWGNKHDIRPSVDVRGEGGYVVAPPSLHSSGARYTWSPENAGMKLASPPGWLIRTERPFEPIEVRPGEGFEEQEKVGEGGRNEYLHKYASKLRGEGYDESALSIAVETHNEKVCDPPLGEDEVRRIVKSVMRYEPNPPEIQLDIGPKVPILAPGDDLAVNIYDFLANPPAPKEPLIGGGILDQGDGFIIAGRPNVGKSWVVFDLAISVATGTKWLDHFDTKPGTVLIIDEEGSARSMWERMTQLVGGRNWPPMLQPAMPLYLKVQGRIKLDTDKGLTIVQRMMERYRPALVIYDSMVRAHSGDENSTQDMSRFFDLTQDLKNAYNSAFMFTHHVRKPMKDDPGDECDMIRGSSDIRGWPEGVILVKQGKDDRQLVLDHCKSRNHRRNQPPILVGLSIDEADGTAKLAYQGRKGDERDRESL